jgi:alpha-D-xyloside xylohydrolase
MRYHPVVIFFLLVSIFACTQQPASITSVQLSEQVEKQGRSYLVSATDGRKLRITPYGEQMIRVQRVRADEAFFPDDHYDIVQSHHWSSELTVAGINNLLLEFSNSKIKVNVDLESLAVSFTTEQDATPVLQEIAAQKWQKQTVSTQFRYDPNEHFTGLGHGYFGREASVDLKGKIVERNYGQEQSQQAPLIVPFYMSSKGYGVFLNSMFSNYFNFGADGEYQMAIDDHGFNGQLDYFFIAGPKLPQVLDNYTQLTGRPRLPGKAMFGLQLSDKGHDHNSPTPSNESWWKAKINAHRQAGFPLDHVVNDNRWRAAGGKRCESKIEWDPMRYPDPAEYARWLSTNGLVSTLDFNRCIGQFSEGWKTEFNLPETGKIDFEDSAPDLTNPDFRAWFWQVFYNKSLDPKLRYPGDALWIDEFDEQGAAPKDMLLANGRSSAEMRNYWFFLIAKALVEDGWDKSEIVQRPYVWVRGMTAGAQRYATLWSGDIHPNNADMQGQIRAMQLAGMSGFPFWGHDAGGFYDWDKGVGPDEVMYQQWAMAFGSFAPIWKPHGMGQSRWPLDRSDASQQAAHKFMRLRYELMPYIYTAAHQAARTGLPIARAMILDYQDDPLAWQYDLQYMWGSDLLVAPVTGQDEVTLWLPPGRWFDYEDYSLLSGDRIIRRRVTSSELPIYVKQGAIIPKRDYALSTAFIDKKKLIIEVYTGANGHYQLVEDDEQTEKYKLNNEKQLTLLEYNEEHKRLIIHPAKGQYSKSPVKRQYQIRFVGIQDLQNVKLNGMNVDFTSEKRMHSLKIKDTPIGETLVIDLE